VRYKNNNGVLYFSDAGTCKGPQETYTVKIKPNSRVGLFVERGLLLLVRRCLLLLWLIMSNWKVAELSAPFSLSRGEHVQGVA